MMRPALRVAALIIAAHGACVGPRTASEMAALFADGVDDDGRLRRRVAHDEEREALHDGLHPHRPRRVPPHRHGRRRLLTAMVFFKIRHNGQAQWQGKVVHWDMLARPGGKRPKEAIEQVFGQTWGEGWIWCGVPLWLRKPSSLKDKVTVLHAWHNLIDVGTPPCNIVDHEVDSIAWRNFSACPTGSPQSKLGHGVCG